MTLSSAHSFADTLKLAQRRIDSYIASKLDSFFDLAEYTWLPRTPPAAQHEPSTYVFEMITFLTANVDSVLFGLNESVKTHVYGNALALINKWFMVSSTYERS